jgi:hypothetical protein
MVAITSSPAFGRGLSILLSREDSSSARLESNSVEVAMAVTKAEVRSGAYYDSVVLMQLQRSLADLPGDLDAGLESFTESLMAPGVPVIQVDWQPPARGNKRLMAILERMRGWG